jgi:hypothetical protein
MLLVVAALIVAAAVAWGCRQVASEIRKAGEGAVTARTLQVMQTFATAAGEAARDPRAILAWAPLARTGRRLFPDEFARLDRAAGASFPFSPDSIQAAHAQWTADWLAWEQTHDAEYKLKAAAAEEELARAEGSRTLRAHLDAIERQKLDLYQRRYAEYVRVAKALQALTNEERPRANA